jgi:septal ring factor EnvC (AmiA/AmiB activator)
LALAMATTFGFASPHDGGHMGSDPNATERIMQLKRIQRRSGAAPRPPARARARQSACLRAARACVVDARAGARRGAAGRRATDSNVRRAGTLERLPMGGDDWAGWGRAQGPASMASGTLDAPLTTLDAPLTYSGAPEAGTKSDMIRALKDTVRYLRSASTDPGAFVDPRSYHGDGAEAADVMQELLKEMEALKTRDASSATVLRMAKENLEQRKEQIEQLQAMLASKGHATATGNAQLEAELAQRTREVQEASASELRAQNRMQQLEAEVDRLKGDLETRRQQDEHMQELLHEVEAQRDVHQREIETMRRENQRLLVQKGEEMDRVLQEAAQEVEAVRSAMARQGVAAATADQAPPPRLPTPAKTPPRSREASRAPSSRGGGDDAATSAEVERLKEALADASTDLQEREQELGAAQEQLLELQKLLKQQSDMLSEVRAREEALAKERGFLQAEGGNTVNALQALQQQVARQKATINTLQADILKSPRCLACISRIR